MWIAIRSLSNDFQKVTFDPVPNRFSSSFVFRHDKPQISIQVDVISVYFHTSQQHKERKKIEGVQRRRRRQDGRITTATLQRQRPCNSSSLSSSRIVQLFSVTIPIFFFINRIKIFFRERPAILWWSNRLLR